MLRKVLDNKWAPLVVLIIAFGIVGYIDEQSLTLRW